MGTKSTLYPINPIHPKFPIIPILYSLLWVMQDLYQQPYSLKVLAVVPIKNSEQWIRVGSYRLFVFGC